MRTLVAGCVATLLILGLRFPARSLPPNDVPQSGADAVSFPASRTVAQAGRTRVIAFRLSAPAGADAELPWSVEPPDLLEVTRPPAVLAGETIGYVQVRARQPGTAALRIGDALIDVAIAPGSGAAAPVPDHLRPSIDSPAPGAAVFGTVAVGVRAWQEPDHPARLELRLSDGRVLSPARTSTPGLGPVTRAVFELDADSLPPGPLDLVPVRVPEDPAAGGATEGHPVRVRVVRAKGVPIVTGEAESPPGVAVPERFRRESVTRTGRDSEASADAFAEANSYGPAGHLALQVDEPAWYQVFLTASGSLAGGALPTVGIIVDNAEQPATNGRLVSERWHRVPVGVPIRLDAGLRVITPVFLNDFYVPGLADRNLRVDRIEVVRVARERASPGRRLGDSGSDEMTAMGGAMNAAMAASMMGGMMTGDAASAFAGDPMGVGPAAVRIAFERPLDGLPVSGAIEVRARAWWAGLEQRLAPPTVALLVNGRELAAQRSGAPRFLVTPDALHPGENTVQLVATLDSGVRAATPAQRVTCQPPEGADAPPPPRWARYSIHEDRWDDDARRRLVSDRYPGERLAIAFTSNAEAAVAIPDDFAGRFRAGLELLGLDYDGPSEATLYLDAGGSRTKLGVLPAPTWWDTRATEPFDLPPGPKRIIVAFENDKFTAGVGDRNLYVQALVLAEVPAERRDTRPPATRALYPPHGQRVRLADAVVADAWDDTALAHAELLIDGQGTGVSVGLERQPGRIVLPLLLRGLDPGEHEVAIRVTDTAGNSTVAEPRRVLVLDPADPGLTDYERAVILLDRFAFGPDRRSLADILTLGEEAWLDASLAAPHDDPGDKAALDLGLVHFAGDLDEYGVPRRALTHAILTPNPVRARFVLWVNNHFSTWIRKPEPDRKWAEHAAFSRLGAAPFLDLLSASASSPAMLLYLDQATSFAGRLNENYAREIMELHTLGVSGGYSQADVTNLARVLTGWLTTHEGDGSAPGYPRATRFAFDPALNDGSEVRWLGARLPAVQRADRYTRVRLVLETLAAHPSTARYVCSKLVEHYAGAPPRDDLTSDLALVFHETGGDMRAVLLAMSRHPAFWEAAATPRLAHPLDFAVRLCRTTGNVNPWELGEYLQRSGHGLFNRATPDGYPEDDAAYTDSNAMLQRWRFAQVAPWAIADLVPPAWRWSDASLTPDTAQRIVDALAVGLTGRTLADRSNAAALDYLFSAQGPTHERVLSLATLVAQLPEANLR